MIEVTIKETTYDVSYDNREDMDDLIYTRDEELFNLYRKLQGMMYRIKDKRKKYVLGRRMKKLRHILYSEEYLFS